MLPRSNNSQPPYALAVYLSSCIGWERENKREEEEGFRYDCAKDIFERKKEKEEERERFEKIKRNEILIT